MHARSPNGSGSAAPSNPMARPRASACSTTSQITSTSMPSTDAVRVPTQQTLLARRRGPTRRCEKSERVVRQLPLYLLLSFASNPQGRPVLLPSSRSHQLPCCPMLPVAPTTITRTLTLLCSRSARWRTMGSASFATTFSRDVPHRATQRRSWRRDRGGTCRRRLSAHDVRLHRHNDTRSEPSSRNANCLPHRCAQRKRGAQLNVSISKDAWCRNQRATAQKKLSGGARRLRHQHGPGRRIRS